jgi:hypothetical protein
MFSRTIPSALLLGALHFVTAAQDDVNFASLAPRKGGPHTPSKSSPPESHPTTGDCIGVNGISPKCRSQESTYQRDFFYIGGGYVDSSIPGQQMWSDQLYVEKMTPASKVNKPYPIVFVSAGVNTGAEWLEYTR